MLRTLSLFFVAAALAPLPAVALVNGAAPQPVRIELTSFAIAPSDIVLEHGKAYEIDIDNLSGGSHSFSAPGLFSASTVSAIQGATIDKGRIELPGKTSAQLVLTVNQAGDYAVRCTHPLHAALGMKGVVHVR